MANNLLILSAELINIDAQKNDGEPSPSNTQLNKRPSTDFIYLETLSHYSNIYIATNKETPLIQASLNKPQTKIKPLILPDSNDLASTLKNGVAAIEDNIPLTIIIGGTYIPIITNLFQEQDALLYAPSCYSERCTVVDIDSDNKIQSIGKEELPTRKNHQAYIGAFHIKSPKELLDLLISKQNNHSLNFHSALKKYFNEREFQFIYAENWTNHDQYDQHFKHKKTVAARSFNHISIDSKNNYIEKKSRHIPKFLDEINWYINLPKSLSYYIPVIKEYSLCERSPFVKMKYYNMPTLHDVFISGNTSIEQWRIILNNLKKLNNIFSNTIMPTNECNSTEELHSMYVGKTLKRLEQFKELNLINPEKPLIINGRTYRTLNDYISFIKEGSLLKDIIQEKEFNIIHGDFCLTNILYHMTENKIKIIDPRGSFGKVKIYGDNLYEWAKLSHSLEGLYDFIIADRFNVKKYGETIYYRIYSHAIHERIKDLFYTEIVPKESISKIRLIQSLLFFSMLPLHDDNQNRQFIMLCRAVELFEPFINKKA